jgi:hypothetical protein
MQFLKSSFPHSPIWLHRVLAPWICPAVRGSRGSGWTRMKKEHWWPGRLSSKTPVPTPGIMKLCQLGSHSFKFLQVFHKHSPTSNSASSSHCSQINMSHTELSLLCKNCHPLGDSRGKWSIQIFERIKESKGKSLKFFEKRNLLARRLVSFGYPAS